ncbi:hypothetical protein DFH06DRAFT_1348308 [Mycena polygramma]|nr:hypothetical protein DFH06DRAFT_1348308 [Mycena polygramma]
MSSPCPTPCLFNSLAPELRRLIYDIVLDPQQERPIRTRSRVCSTCRNWRTFVEATPSYWTFILVDSEVAPSSVLRFIALASSLPLEFRIVLKSSEPILNLAYLSASLLTAVRLTIESDRLDTLHRLRQTFHGLSTPLLVYFAASLHRIPSSYAQFVAPPIVNAPWLPDAGAQEALEALHLNCSPLPFPHFIFPRLQTLHLSGRHFRYNVDVNQLAVVMANSPLLASLTIHRFHCFGLDPSIPAPVIRSSSVREMDIVFSHTDDTMALASTFDFPSLSKLTVDITSVYDGIYLSLLPHATLSTVSTLVLTKRLTRDKEFPFISSALLGRFHNLTSLDIRSCHPWVFTQLLAAVSEHAASTGSILLRRLGFLAVHHAPMHDLVSFATLYGASDADDGSHSVLRRIWTSACLCEHSFDPDVVGSRQWLSSHVLDFVVEFSQCGTHHVSA